MEQALSNYPDSVLDTGKLRPDSLTATFSLGFLTCEVAGWVRISAGLWDIFKFAPISGHFGFNKYDRLFISLI
jgi:predicted P-loop ATPase/GTPase